MSASAEVSNSSRESGSGLSGPVLLLSLAVLTQELLLVRLLAVAQWHHITYMVVTTALLAFGLSGTLLALVPWLGGRDAREARTRFAIYAALFTLTSFGTAWMAAKGGVETVDLLEGRPGLARLVAPSWKLFRVYLVTGLPLLFGGLGVAVSLRWAGGRMGRTYCANLLGSALGCGALLLFLEPLTGPGLLAATAAVGALASAWTFRSLAPRVVAWSLLGACIILTIWPDNLPAILPVASKKIVTHVGRGEIPIPDAQAWNPLCRIDVTRSPNDDFLTVFQDCDAPTWIYPVDAPEPAEIGFPWRLRPDARSLLVIGAGGGREMAAAVQRGASRIVGVEINSSTVALLTDRFREFTRGRTRFQKPLLEQPGVELINAEGRAWLSGHSERFDIIQMTGVDTYAALSSGAYVVSESYLYTAEAFDSYLAHLNDQGLLTIYRFSFQPPRETLRLFVMALDALERRGIDDPGRHAIVVRSNNWAALMISMEPISVATMTTVRDHVARAAFSPGGTPPEIQHDALERRPTPYFEYAQAVLEGRKKEFFRTYPYDVRPVTDDSPFFYQYHRWDGLWQRLRGKKDPSSPELPGTRDTVLGKADAWRANTGEIPTGLLVLFALMLQATLAGTVLILGPLLVFRLRDVHLRKSLSAIAFFGSLGFGFMLAEIALAQKLCLFLGNPAKSLPVVIGGLLVAAGFGSLLTGRRHASGVIMVATSAVALGLFAVPMILPLVTDSWLARPWIERAAAALVLVMPLGFFMGMPMPAGLRTVSERHPVFIPWAFGVNGIASVVGSVVAVILAMAVGFSGVLWIAAGCYGLALVTRPRS